MQDTTDVPAISLDKVDALRHSIADLFVIHDTTLDRPQPGQVRFRGYFLQDPAVCFDELRRRFEQHGFTPMIRRGSDNVALIALPVVFNPSTSSWFVNLALFVATVLSTLYIGALYQTGEFEGWRMLWRGWPFSLSLLLILGTHELGHYFAARYHNVPVSLPYFIPLPTRFSLIGTMGAFIRLKAPVKNRRALLDVGAAGPLAGMVFAVPILLYGLATSEVGPLPVDTSYILEGNSILYWLAKFIVFGRPLPAGGVDVQLNQVAWAGWVGLLVTGLNLIPLGQLDGGHVAYVLFGKKARQLFWPAIIGLIGLAALTSTPMWFIWVVLLYFLGRYHAVPLDDVTALDSRRRLIAFFTLLLFVLVFTPVPIRLVLP
jgi:membrane-associated protease RseP (regulator of RpoE activity)